MPRGLPPDLKHIFRSGTVAVAFSLHKEEVKISFLSPPYQEEVMIMVTWELLILFCSLLVAIIKLVYDICNNNKKDNRLLSKSVGYLF